MSNQKFHDLTEADIATLKNALSEVIVQAAKKSALVDNATDDPTILDPFHALNAETQKAAKALLELLDDAVGVRVELPE